MVTKTHLKTSQHQHQTLAKILPVVSVQYTVQTRAQQQYKVGGIYELKRNSDLVVLHEKFNRAVLQPTHKEDECAPDAHLDARTVDRSAPFAPSFVPYCSDDAAVHDAHVDSRKDGAAER